jgi:type II restriction/modification system DNA methylase subunit YeeA
MDTSRLKKFAQYARRSLIEQVSAKMKLALAADGPARRENPAAVAELEKMIKESSADKVIETTAYTWFNRFCALRFMDACGYNAINIVSPAPGQTQPEILAEAKMGHIDAEMVPDAVGQKVMALLSGAAPSREPQAEAYRMLLTACCNYYNRQMPFLFEKIADCTELMMPDDLLSDNSILTAAREAMAAGDCADVEAIGWLYQFYISEKKDEVFDGLKKNKKITPENIPAATQLFTPAWIVRYLVENSLGRLWMLNRPQSKLRARMEYYIPDAAQGSVENNGGHIKINSPEDIKICDPACGSGHMLVYAFELLYDIYEEEGFDPSEIAVRILKNNLYGVEIDGRAGTLASFALAMKARGKYRRYFKNPVQPNICVLENIHFSKDELEDYMNEVGRDLFTTNLETTLKQFEESDNFGSLIRPALTNTEDIVQILHERGVEGKLFILKTHEKVLRALKQADYLSPKYHVVIANPPYMGGKGMNEDLKKFLQQNYEEVKSDLFSAFIVRNSELAVKKACLGIMCPNVWMYITSHENLRNYILEQKTLTNLVELPLSGFKGATVQICAFNFLNYHTPDFKGGYIRLVNLKGGDEEMAAFTINAIKDSLIPSTTTDPISTNFYRASSSDFKKIPGSPIAYWISKKFVDPFLNAKELIYDLTISDGQTKTGDNDKYLKFNWEVSSNNVGNQNKWWHHPKGGPFRKWYGNVDWVIDWSDDARNHYRKDRVARILPNYLWGKKGLSWTLITISEVSFRILESNHIFNLAAPSLFFHDETNIQKCLGFLNTKYVAKILKVINPTLNMNVGDVRCLPLLQTIDLLQSNINCIVNKCINISKSDWDFYETSWDFTRSPLLDISNISGGAKNEPQSSPSLSVLHSPLSALYASLRSRWREMTLEMHKLEEENNRIFIDAYGLSDELTPDVPLKEITLTCNPHYRYGGDKTEDELEALLLADTMKEFISYSAGCMFGRYALDKAGLVLANQGETIEDYLKQIPEPIFPADDDNVIPILDGEWFPDDITERFYNFLRTAFGAENFDDNLKFIETAIGKDIRKYFTKDFYNDHVKRYKKRPIYWLFSSPKGSFNALIYMHRYRPDTVSVVLNDYLREFRTKLASQKSSCEHISISSGSSAAEKTRALKEIDKIKKITAELDEYERDTLYPLATKQIAIDLDDGVKVNYLKFGTALKKIAGLDDKEE